MPSSTASFWRDANHVPIKELGLLVNKSVTLVGDNTTVNVPLFAITGTVEVIAQGEKAALDRLIQYLHKGSILSRVDDVRIEWRTPQKSFDSFTLVR